MAALDRFTINMSCSACGRKGTVDVSEKDHPYMKPHAGFSIDRVSNPNNSQKGSFLTQVIVLYYG